MAKVETDPVGVEPAAQADAAMTELAEDPTAHADAVLAEVPPAIMAQSLADYLRGWVTRLKNGESGILPVLLGLVIIGVIFQIISPGHVFLSASNLVNLFQQSAVFMVLGMGEIFVLLLGEIDLSLGYNAGVAGVIAVQFVEPQTRGWFWLFAIIVALLSVSIIGAVQGALVAYLRLPSFIVTLGFYLILNGMMLILLLLGPFSGYPSLLGNTNNLQTIYNLMWGNIDPTASWIAMAGVVVVVGAIMWVRDDRRRRNGLTAPPPSLTLIRIAIIAIIGVVVVAICNTNRGVGVVEVKGVPWVIPIVLGLLGLWMILLEQTRFGRYLYAIGGNAEAARRAGINLGLIRTWAFALCAFTGGVAGLLYVAYLGGASNNINGGQLVLYAVAAAVIGGTSLFGGRGRIMHGVLGGLVIGGIYNGMYLQGISVQWTFIVTGFVLIAAVMIDALSRRGATRV